MTQQLKFRVAKLEDDVGPQVGVADCLEAARLRLRAMSSEEREAERRARYLHALNSEPPEGPLALRLWQADRRLARFLGLDATATHKVQ